MPTYKVLFVARIMLAAAILSACGGAVPTAQPDETPAEAIYTAAVLTIAAQLTQAAETSTGTPAPPATIEPTQVLTPTLQDTPTTIATSSPTETIPEATATERPTQTPSAGDPRERLGNPSWQETFDGDAIWYTYEDEHIRMRGVGGNLEMTAFNPDFRDGWILTGRQADDFYLELTGTFETCEGLDRFGLMARATQGARAGYLFGFSCDGRYSLWMWDGEKKIDLVSWTSSDQIKAGSNQTNRLGFLADGDRLSLFANGNLLIEISDDTYESGGFGVFVGAVRTPNFTVSVEKLSYWDLP